MIEVKRSIGKEKWEYRLSGRWLNALEALAYVMQRTNLTANAAQYYLDNLQEVSSREA